jgi:hypothetical protein
MTYNLLPYFTSLSVLLQAQYKLTETNLNDTNVLLCNIKNKVGHIMSITTLDLIHQNLRCGKLFQTNNNFLECFQNYHAFILSKIVSHASSDVLSLLIPILDTTSQLPCISVTPQVLFHTSCNKDQHVVK